MTAQKNEKWSHRFIMAAIIQSIFAAIWTIPIVLPWIKPSVAMVIAAGSAGTWFTVGYILYIIVGVLGNAAIGLIYQHFETVEGKVVSGISNALAWLQLILFNFGVMASTWALMIAGYFGEADLLPPAVGGKGLTEGQVHVLLLSHFINPVGAFVIIAVLGVIIGAIAFFTISLKE
ncbi:MAG: hypothetical protein ACP5LF_03210 [Nitrososphaeria archaeon]|nr:hypothetical protein [Conexivisphaerales archaeon]